MLRRLALAVCLAALFLAVSHAGNTGQNIIVQLSEGQSIHRINAAYGTQMVAKVSRRPIYLVHTDDSTGTTLKHIRNDHAVAIAENNSQFHLGAASIPVSASPNLGQDMAALLDGSTTTTFNGTTVLNAYANQLAVSLISVNKIRGISTGAGTRVAYIDTGIDPNHPALAPWADPGVDLVFNESTSEFDGLSQDMAALLDQDMAALLDKRMFFLLDQSLASILSGASSASAFPPDWGHGTMVAGAIHVVAPDARLVPIKAFDAYGNTTMFTIVQSVYWAIDHGVDVLNMSFSTDQQSTLFANAISDAKDAGIAMVSAAGNSGINAQNLYPASFANVVGVAATDFNDHIASFSNYGRSVSVSAPGAFVVSTVPGGRYAAAWGTSFSAPLVSGTVALLVSSYNRGQSGASQVINTADSIDAINPGFANLLGRGRIDAERALKVRR
jgi:subtilisin family serine protease